jgi:hypothetical protein
MAMGMVGDMVVSGVTGAIRNPPAKEKSSPWQSPQRPVP